MEYQELRFIDIKKNGQKLGTKKLNYPVLYQGMVYKRFDIGNRLAKIKQLYLEKERLMLTLEKLNLKYLTKVKSILTQDNKAYGYTYLYNDSILMKDYLQSLQSLEERLKYIGEILETHNALLKEGLTYMDYHSGNFLMDKQVIFIDIDSIIDRNAFSSRYIKEYLFTLMLSLFLNYDLTDTPDLAPYYNILRAYFKTPNLYEYDLLDLNQVFEEMMQKEEDTIPVLVRQIYEEDVKSQI